VAVSMVAVSMVVVSIVVVSIVVVVVIWHAMVCIVYSVQCKCIVQYLSCMPIYRTIYSAVYKPYLSCMPLGQSTRALLPSYSPLVLLMPSMWDRLATR
jgi:hypothetical protein